MQKIDIQRFPETTKVWESILLDWYKSGRINLKTFAHLSLYNQEWREYPEDHYSHRFSVRF